MVWKSGASKRGSKLVDFIGCLGWAATLWFAGLSTLANAQDGGIERHEFQQVEMGVQFRLAFYASSKTAANKAAEATFSRIRELNSRLSDYDSTSELMQLCVTSGPEQPVEVSPDLGRVLETSARVAEQSTGAFDISVGHITKLWRRARRQKQLPTPQELQEALAFVGYRQIKLEIRNSNYFVTLSKPGMRLDLGGIAKGYAADEALKTLRHRGISQALVAASGDISVSDPPPGERGWTVSLESPTASKAASEKLLLANQSVSTSGDAYQHVEISGRRYSHIVDPKTGIGLSQRGSATVVASSGMEADSFATAIVVLGPEKGMQFLESQRSHGVAAEALILSVRPDESIERHASRGWENVLSRK